jgi:molybdenum cofactor synthesis domain-containing protein
MSENPTACLLVIGNEVLSGRTQDANLKYVATRLGELGIVLREARVIPDVPNVIVRAVNETRAAFDHVFTTGGIGPTHDDITSECISAAFGVPWEIHAEAFAKMNAAYKSGDFNAARQRMATMPRGASLIETTVSIAPGFSIGNVHVMAGVPRIMQAQFEAVAKTLKGGLPIIMRAVHAKGVLEGALATDLSAIQGRYAGLDIGSYPYYREGGGGVAIVAKGTDAPAAEAAIREVTALMQKLGGAPVQGEPPAA